MRFEEPTIKNEKLEITVKSIKDHEIQPDSENNAADQVKEIPQADKNILDKLSKIISPEVKAELLQAFNEQLSLLKEAIQAFSEKINWGEVDEKKAAAYALYALGGVIGTLSASNPAESAEGDENQGSNFDQIFLDNVHNDYEQFKTMGAQKEMADLYLDKTKELYGIARDRNLPIIRVQQAMDGMMAFTESTVNDNGDIFQLKTGYDEIINDFSKENIDSANQEIENKNELDTNLDQNFGLLPEKEELKFCDKYTPLKQSQIQQYYNGEIDTIHEMAIQFNDWQKQYGHKDNFDQFESNVSEAIAKESERLIDIKETVADPGRTLNLNSVGSGKIDSKMVAAARLIKLDDEIRMRTTAEKLNDQIKRAQELMNEDW